MDTYDLNTMLSAVGPHDQEHLRDDATLYTDEYDWEAVGANEYLMRYQEWAFTKVDLQWQDNERELLTMCVLGIGGEGGEIIDLAKKILYNSRSDDADVQNQFVEEMGDLMWYIINLCRLRGVSLMDIIDGNVEKLNARHVGGFDPTEADRRVMTNQEGEQFPIQAAHEQGFTQYDVPNGDAVDHGRQF